MPITPDDEEKLRQQQEHMGGIIQSELDRIKTLPYDQQMQELPKVQALQNTMRQDNIKKRQILQFGGKLPEEEKNPGEGVLSFLARNIDRTNTAKNAGLLYTLTGEQKYADIMQEAATGQNKDPITGAEVLEKMGMPESGTLSDILPWAFNETGEGMALQKGGILDVTGRGAAGFGFDVMTDPLNAIPVGKIAAGASKLTGEMVKNITGKSIHTLAYENKIFKPIGRLFSDMSLLAKTPETSALYKNRLLNYAHEMGNIDDNTMRSLVENDVLKSVRPVLDDPIQHEYVLNTMRDIQDISSSIAKGDWNSLSKSAPELVDMIPQAVKNGELDTKELINIYKTNKFKTPQQRTTADFFEQLWKNQGDRKEIARLLTKAEIDKNPFYIPNKAVDMEPIESIDQLQQMAIQHPELKEVFENMIMSRKQALADEGVEQSLSNILRKQVGPSLSEKERVFGNWRMTANYSKARNGRLIDNLVTLAYDSEKSLARREASLGLMKDLKEISGGGDIPREVADTIRSIVKQNTPESWSKAANLWNRYFLNPLKRGLTLPHPAYVIRNVVDDAFRTFQSMGYKSLNPELAIDAGHVAFGGSKEIALSKELSVGAQQLQTDFYKSGIIRNNFLRSDLLKTQDNIISQWKAADPAKRASMKAVIDHLFNAGQIVGTHFENFGRSKAALMGLKEFVEKEGIKSISDPKWAEALTYAAKKMRKPFFDYNELGPIDRALANFIPFYRFSRSNIPFQIETLIQNPQRFGVIAKSINAFNKDPLTKQEQNALAPYLKNGIYFSLGNNGVGDHILLSGTGLSVEDLSKIWEIEGPERWVEKVLVGQTIPQAQFLYSMASNRNPFFGTELDDFRARKTYKTFHDIPLFNKLVGGISKELVATKEGKGEYVYTLDSPKQYALVMNVLVPSITAFTGNFPGTLGLSGVLSTRGLQTIGKLTDEKMTNDMGVLSALTGLKLQTRNLNRDAVIQLYKTTKDEFEKLSTQTWHLKNAYRISRQLSDPERQTYEDDLNEEE